jgi:hypothetical protein
MRKTAVLKGTAAGKSAKAKPGRKHLRPSGTAYLVGWNRRARYLALIFFRIRRSSMKQSPDVVHRTQPIMMITFMSISARAPLPPALQTYRSPESTLPERYSKTRSLTVAILATQGA